MYTIRSIIELAIFLLLLVAVLNEQKIASFEAKAFTWLMSKRR